MSQPKITLLICTHNGSRTIRQALEAIAEQQDEDVAKDSFEVLVIDNASEDNTFEIAVTTLQSLHLPSRVLQQPKLGKMNAFLMGVQEAKGEFISIVDDDNFIDPGFIHYTLEIFARFSDVGMVGSNNRIHTDQELPIWFQWVRGRYACSSPLMDEIEQCTHDGLIISQMSIIAGAGSSFRLQPLRDCLELGYIFFNDARHDKKMSLSGEDIELCWLFRSLGYKFAYDPRIQVRHAIKPDRLSIESFDILCKTIGTGSLGCDPYSFTYKYSKEHNLLKWTWQWQLISKLKRYIRFTFFPENNGSSNEERKFRNRIAKIECMAAIQRILQERENYTQHIRQVASGNWTKLRVR